GKMSKKTLYTIIGVAALVVVGVITAVVLLTVPPNPYPDGPWPVYGYTQATGDSWWTIDQMRPVTDEDDLAHFW
ncbi:hypothetical protein KIPB_013557, partial [Kipferlia bialata]